MNSQEKQGYIDEINYQKKMIHNLIISILAIILVGKAIYSGKKNINKIVDQFSFKYKNSL